MRPRLIQRLALAALLLAGLLPGAGFAAPAPETVRLEAQTVTANFAGRALYLVDRTGTLSLEKAVAQRDAGGFNVLTTPTLTAGLIPGGAVWLNLRVARAEEAPVEWWLYAGEAMLDRITLYEETAPGVFEVRQSGRALPYAERLPGAPSHGFPIQFADSTGRDFFLRYESHTPLNILAEMVTPQVLEMRHSRVDFVEGMYVGVVILALLLAGVRTLRYLEPMQGTYTLYVLALGTMDLSLRGRLPALVHEDMLWRWHMVETTAILVAVLSIIGFLRFAVSWPPEVVRRWDRTLVLSALLLTSVFALVWQYWPGQSFRFVMYAGAGTLLLITALLAWASYRGFPNARLIALAFAPFVFVGAWEVAQGLGVAPGSPRIGSLWMLTTALHIVVLFGAILARDAALRGMNKRLEWELNHTRENLENQSMFMRLLAHELRTPLAVVDGHSQLLQRLDATHPDVREAAGVIRVGARQVSRVVERFLSQDRLASIQSLDRARVTLSPLIAAAVNEAQSLTEDHFIRTHVDPALPALYADPELLRLMLRNLLENAVNYSPEGGGIEVRAYSEGPEAVIIEVIDEGIGIAAKDQERVFERYHRTEDHADVQGAGLGLYIVRNIARLHGGEVSCESTPGEGSIFRVTLPTR